MGFWSAGALRAKRGRNRGSLREKWPERWAPFRGLERGGKGGGVLERRGENGPEHGALLGSSERRSAGVYDGGYDITYYFIHSLICHWIVLFRVSMQL